MSTRHTPRNNQLLARLPSDDYARLLPDLELSQMPLGKAVYEADTLLRYAYFPTTSLVSLISVLPNGDTAEIAITGNDGFVGTPLLLGGKSTPNRAVVQSGGYAYRIKTAALKRELGRKGPLQEIALQYAQVLITQMAQTIVCNRHHSVVQQLCRWLLLSLDRLPSNVVTMTQGLVANMLGVRLEGVTSAAGRLQEEGVITYSRGRITVINRPAMEMRACACYGVVKREQERLLPTKAEAKTEAVARLTLKKAVERGNNLPSSPRGKRLMGESRATQNADR